MYLNLRSLPPRVLRIIVAFIGIFVLVLTSGLFIQWHSARPATHGRPSIAKGPEGTSPVKETIFYPPLGQIPWWTTEQERPKFAYAQYATNLDYLCNSVRICLIVRACLFVYLVIVSSI